MQANKPCCVLTDRKLGGLVNIKMHHQCWCIKGVLKGSIVAQKETHTMQNVEAQSDECSSGQIYIFARAASMESTSCNFFRGASWSFLRDGLLAAFLTDGFAATFFTFFFLAAFLAAFFVMMTDRFRVPMAAGTNALLFAASVSRNQINRSSRIRMFTPAMGMFSSVGNSRELGTIACFILWFTAPIQWLCGACGSSHARAVLSEGSLGI